MAFRDRRSRRPVARTPKASRTVPQVDNSRLLVASDDTDLRLYLQRSLARIRGFSFGALLYADSAAAAADLARKTRPSLAVVDEDFGRAGEEHLVETLRSSPETTAIPIVLLTGSRTLHGPRHHASALLPKPFNATQLEAAIRSVRGSHGVP